MARLRVFLSVAASAADGSRRAAITPRSRGIRLIEGYKQGRRLRVSVQRAVWGVLGGLAPQAGRRPCPLRYSEADGHGRQAREAGAEEADRRQDPAAATAALAHGPGPGRRRRDRRR